MLVDGGGIRGYWSLLALQKLMNHIAECEQNQPDDPAPHSFHPEAWPRHVSQVPRDEEKEPPAQHVYDPSDEKERFDELLPSRRYLPVHYFDYIGGSSTGGQV